MIIHIAGFPVRVGNHKRQLCAWCGFALVDVDLEGCISSDGSEPGHWEPNALIQVQGTNPTSFTVIQHTDGDPIPVGFCGDADLPPVLPRLRLVESQPVAVNQWLDSELPHAEEGD